MAFVAVPSMVYTVQYVVICSPAFGWPHRRRIELEDKAKVVASD